MNVDRQERIQYLVEDYNVHNNPLDEWEEARLFYVLLDRLGIDENDIFKGKPSSEAALERTCLDLTHQFDISVKKVEKQFKGEMITDEVKFLVKESLIKELRIHIDNRFLSRIDIEMIYYRSGNIEINIVGEDGETDFKTIVRNYHPMFAFYK